MNGPDGRPRRVAACRRGGGLDAAVRSAVEYCGILDGVRPDTRVSLKPNLTYPTYKAGVTTSPEVMEALIRAVKEATPHIAVVETDGGYGAWRADAAFGAHRLWDMQRRYGIEVVNLNDEAREPFAFRSRGRWRSLPLPTRLLHETDLFITMPVPKIHAMTVVSLAYKNQWGCIPDAMRLRRHHLFADAILAINRRLKPCVLADGTFFLDNNGPMEGDAIREDLIIGATDPGSFATYVCELMGIPHRRAAHLRRAVQAGDMPRDLAAIGCNVAPAELATRRYALRRTLRNYLALAGFNSRWVTWLGYESWFGRVVLHAILYAFAGHPPEREER